MVLKEYGTWNNEKYAIWNEISFSRPCILTLYLLQLYDYIHIYCVKKKESRLKTNFEVAIFSFLGRHVHQPSHDALEYTKTNLLEPLLRLL